MAESFESLDDSPSEAGRETYKPTELVSLLPGLALSHCASAIKLRARHSYLGSAKSQLFSETSNNIRRRQPTHK
ncbi:hypothetical protein PSPO01_12476 [Paraphaeosphaeria sporulosa]